MERNLRGEIFTAVLVLLLLLTVGLSAVFLSSVGAPSAPLTATVATLVSNVDDPPTDTASPTAPAPVTLTATPTQTPSQTPPRPTETERPTETPLTPTVRATETERATLTRTRVPSQTPTLAPTRTLPPTYTPLPPTTERATAAPPTVVAAVPTDTASPTHTPRATATPRPSMTALPVTPSITPTLVPCSAPAGWTTYTVVRGNTLFSIARAVGSTVGELRTVNCLADADNIQVGGVLFVPRAPTSPIQTGVPRALPSSQQTQLLVLEGCSSPASVITSPSAGQQLRGTFDVIGTATIDDGRFQFYRLEVRPDFTNVYNFYARSDVPIYNGLLGRINAGLFDPGLYWIRLTVVDRTGNFITPCAIPVVFAP